MRKLFLTLIVAIAFSGSVLAQESHYPNVTNDFETQGALVAGVSIDGILIGPSYDNYIGEGLYINYNYEVAAYTGSTLRGHGFLYYYDDGYYPDPCSTTNGMPIGYNFDSADDVGLTVTFKLYDHINNLEYYLCDVTYQGEPFVVKTGDENIQGWYDVDDYILLSFSTPTFTTSQLAGYGSDVNNKVWHLIASPLNSEVAAADVNLMTSNNYDIYRFNQSAVKEWENYKQEGEHYQFNIEPGRGYLYANSSDVTLTFTGWPYEPDEMGCGHVTLTRADDHNFSGWNLIGNPLDHVASIGSKDFYRMNEDNSDIYYAGSGGSVYSMEGIFVIAEEDGEDVTFTPVPAKSAYTQENVVVNLSRNNGKVIDRAVVRFGDGGSFPKFMIDENNAHICIPQDDQNFAVVNGNNADMIQVNFKADRVGEYMLNVNVENMDIDYLHLIDRVSGDDVDLLLNDSYSFMGAPSDRNDRFELRFSNDSQSSNEIFVYQNGSNIVVTGEGTLQVFDVMGRFVNAYDIHGVETIESMPAGVYVFRVIGEFGELIRTQKIVVR